MKDESWRMPYHKYRPRSLIPLLQHLPIPSYSDRPSEMRFLTKHLPVLLLITSQAWAAPTTPNEPNELVNRDYQQFKGCTADQTEHIKHALSDAAV